MASTRAQKVPQNRHPTFSARTTKLQNTVHTSGQRALTESLRVGGSFNSETFCIGCDDVRLWRDWTCVAARGFNAWDPPLVKPALLGLRLTVTYWKRWCNVQKSEWSKSIWVATQMRPCHTSLSDGVSTQLGFDRSLSSLDNAMACIALPRPRHLLAPTVSSHPSPVTVADRRFARWSIRRIAACKSLFCVFLREVSVVHCVYARLYGPLGAVCFICAADTYGWRLLAFPHAPNAAVASMLPSSISIPTGRPQETSPHNLTGLYGLTSASVVPLFFLKRADKVFAVAAQTVATYEGRLREHSRWPGAIILLCVFMVVAVGRTSSSQTGWGPVVWWPRQWASQDSSVIRSPQKASTRPSWAPLRWKRGGSVPILRGTGPCKEPPPPPRGPTGAVDLLHVAILKKGDGFGAQCEDRLTILELTNGWMHLDREANGTSPFLSRPRRAGTLRLD